jgi:2-iminobutanoate/2-iminopropanoate deaminase
MDRQVILCPHARGRQHEVGVLLTNPSDFDGMNEEYATWFQADSPARYVAKLGVEIPGVLVSIRRTAFLS